MPDTPVASAEFTDEELHLEYGDIREAGFTQVYSIEPAQKLIDSLARFFQRITDQRDGTTSEEPSKRAIAWADEVAGKLAKRLSWIIEDDVVEHVLDEEVRNAVAGILKGDLS